jgi:hypothetical protein
MKAKFKLKPVPTMKWVLKETEAEIMYSLILNMSKKKKKELLYNQFGEKKVEAMEKIMNNMYDRWDRYYSCFGDND